MHGGAELVSPRTGQCPHPHGEQRLRHSSETVERSGAVMNDPLGAAHRQVCPDQPDRRRNPRDHQVLQHRDDFVSADHQDGPRLPLGGSISQISPCATTIRLLTGRERSPERVRRPQRSEGERHTPRHRLTYSMTPVRLSEAFHRQSDGLRERPSDSVGNELVKGNQLLIREPRGHLGRHGVMYTILVYELRPIPAVPVLNTSNFQTSARPLGTPRTSATSDEASGHLHDR